MIVAIWDFLFTRRIWTIIERENYIGEAQDGTTARIGYIYILQDQFGNIKRKVVTA